MTPRIRATAVRLHGRLAHELSLRAVDRRRRYFVEARGHTPYLAVHALDGCTYLLPTADIGVSCDMFVRGFRPETFVLRRVAAALGRPREPRCHVVDVGANIGTTVVPSLRTYGYERAVAVEPFPGNAVALRLNCVLNGVGELVEVVEAAVSDAPGEAELEGRSKGWGTFQLAGGGVAGASRVDVVSLDSLVDDGRVDPTRVGLLWIDVQGHEGHVLRGAGKLLEHSPPLVVALRRAKMQEAGGARAFAEAARKAYTHVVDVRSRKLREANWVPEYLPVERLDAFLVHTRKTDLLLVDRRR